MDNQQITIEAIISKPIGEVWEKWSLPEHIVNWNHASDDWHTPSAENDFRAGGRFNYRMAARDGSSGFDFWGTYDEIIPGKKVVYTLGDGRKVVNVFTEVDGGVKVVITFDAETTYPLEMQKAGWGSILDNFKKYTEAA